MTLSAKVEVVADQRKPIELPTKWFARGTQLDPTSVNLGAFQVTNPASKFPGFAIPAKAGAVRLRSESTIAAGLPPSRERR
jgi:hypothetical protein